MEGKLIMKHKISIFINKYQTTFKLFLFHSLKPEIWFNHGYYSLNDLRLADNVERILWRCFA